MKKISTSTTNTSATTTNIPEQDAKDIRIRELKKEVERLRNALDTLYQKSLK